MSYKQNYGFKDPTSLTKWTKWFLYVQIVIDIIAVISNMLEYQLLSDFKNGVYISQELAVAAGEASDTRQGIVGIFQVVIFFVSWILILKWIYRANYNAHQLGASGMVFTPGWSIGWYFIPIANLWKPYQAMKEIWQVSANPQSWSSQPVTSILPWWWFFWIISSMLGNASFRLVMKAEEIDEFIIANIVTQLSDIISIPLSFIVISMISKVYKMQMSHAETMKNIQQYNKVNF